MSICLAPGSHFNFNFIEGRSTQIDASRAFHRDSCCSIPVRECNLSSYASPRLASPLLHYFSMTDLSTQPCLPSIPPRWGIAHLRRRPIPRRRRTATIPRRRRRNIIPIAIRGTIVAPSCRPGVVSPCVAVVVPAAAAAAVVVMVVVVTAGVRGAVVVGVAVAGSS